LACLQGASSFSLLLLVSDGTFQRVLLGALTGLRFHHEDVHEEAEDVVPLHLVGAFLHLAFAYYNTHLDHAPFEVDGGSNGDDHAVHDREVEDSNVLEEEGPDDDQVNEDLVVGHLVVPVLALRAEVVRASSSYFLLDDEEGGVGLQVHHQALVQPPHADNVDRAPVPQGREQDPAHSWKYPVHLLAHHHLFPTLGSASLVQSQDRHSQGVNRVDNYYALPREPESAHSC